MYALGSRLVPSDEIRLYANDMQRRYTEYGIKLELKLMKHLLFILLCLYFICAEYEFETFGSTSDEIRLMAFYVHTDVIDIGVETIYSISDKIGIITNDL